eukprot:CAMPEP_0172886644 /NCGR_PEP_ID=MMETSP1075-20121228/131615_1 /TAXON_ID=2916 /ORGANISM="Ceratium fusus, Strain PA161109" /LENGTH=115 /DNA_ID=CAMNT_0013740171 /DNA_START=762 /DNA_END=1110 /DNA_ORIENTATION=-
MAVGDDFVLLPMDYKQRRFHQQHTGLVGKTLLDAKAKGPKLSLNSSFSDNIGDISTRPPILCSVAKAMAGPQPIDRPKTNMLSSGRWSSSKTNRRQTRTLSSTETSLQMSPGQMP